MKEKLIKSGLKLIKNELKIANSARRGATVTLGAPVTAPMATGCGDPEPRPRTSSVLAERPAAPTLPVALQPDRDRHGRGPRRSIIGAGAPTCGPRRARKGTCARCGLPVCQCAASPAGRRASLPWAASGGCPAGAGALVCDNQPALDSKARARAGAETPPR